MFNQNSNDLVKNASISSGHIQNSNETRSEMIRQQAQSLNAQSTDTGVDAGVGGDDAGASLSLGSKFQNMIQGLIDTVSMKEGMGANTDATVDQTVTQSRQYTQQETKHAEKVKSILSFIDKDDRNTRKNWVEVTDSANIAKYGYITKDGIFQIWHAPTSPSPNWLGTDKMKNNSGVIGCPAVVGASSLRKIKIAGTWENLKPFELVYAENDSGRTNPLFMLGYTGLRVRNDGLTNFSCGNERGNVIVTERPSADFRFDSEGITIGCYEVNNNVTDSQITNRGFTFQEDLTEASISQCKRRAEDLGSSYFLLSSPQSGGGKETHRGGCWVYTADGKPNISGLFTYDANATKCHAVNNPEEDEDGYLKAYTTAQVKRLYGKRTNSGNSVALYSLKRDGPSGVDTKNRNERGSIGKIAYIDHNGERHDYPASALSFVKPTKENPGSYINLGGYDTRSAESSYSLKEVTPGSMSDAANLLYKASRDGWSPQKFHQLCDNKGATYTRAITTDGRVLGAYISVSWTSNAGYVKDTTAFLYDGTTKYTTNNGMWGAGEYAVYMNSGYLPTFGGGHDMYIGGDWMYLNAYSYVLSDRSAPFTTKLQMANLYGPWIGRQVPAEIKMLDDGRHVYVIEDGPYTKMVSSDGQEKYYTGNMSQFKSSNWNSYNPTGGGKYLLNRLNQYKEFPRRGWGSYEKIGLKDIEVYAVDANTFPQTNPPDYSRKLRTMPVGERISVSMEKCREMCDDDEKCGGFVYTKTSGAGTGGGMCELKDKAKMYPVGVRVADSSKQLMLKVPTINAGIGDDDCRANNGKYTAIDTSRYAHYPDTGAMTSGTKCSMSDIIPKEGTLTAPSTTGILAATNNQIGITAGRTAEYRAQTTVSASGSEPFTTVREGVTTYYDAMKDVSNNLLKIANANYQRERLLAMTQETNQLLMAESYKFILWSVLAILAVLALLKIKEMFGQDDADSSGSDDGGGGGGILATILGWFGVLKSSTNTDDIADRTQDVKEALSSAGEQLKETGQQLATGITEGADNLVASANQAAEGAVEGAKEMATKVSETAADAVNKVGDAVASATSTAPAAAAAAPATSGSGSGSVAKTGGGTKRKK